MAENAAVGEEQGYADAAENLADELEQINDTADYLPIYKVSKMVGRALSRFGNDMDIDVSSITAKFADQAERKRND